MICGHCVVPRGKGIELNRVLFIELSATLRHAAKKIMETHGYQVDDVASFAAGLAKIHETEKDFPYDAVALGWPSKTDHAAESGFTKAIAPDKDFVGSDRVLDPAVRVADIAEHVSPADYRA